MYRIIKDIKKSLVLLSHPGSGFKQWEEIRYLPGNELFLKYFKRRLALLVQHWVYGSYYTSLIFATSFEYLYHRYILKADKTPVGLLSVIVRLSQCKRCQIPKSF